MPIVDYILARLKEPSTWAGIAIFFGMFGLDADIISRITANGPAVITAVAALIAIFAPSVLKNVDLEALRNINFGATPGAAVPPPAQTPPPPPTGG